MSTANPLAANFSAKAGSIQSIVPENPFAITTQASFSLRELGMYK